jgi:toxin ParE1/3/4
MRVEFARTAINHIAKIHDYIANAKGNPEAAKRVVAAIERTTRQLADFPACGRPGARPRTRELVVREYPYIIVYRELAEAVRVIAVFHAARNIPRGRTGVGL